jgi:hexaprenyl-diphosphate synthase
MQAARVHTPSATALAAVLRRHAAGHGCRYSLSYSGCASTGRYDLGQRPERDDASTRRRNRSLTDSLKRQHSSSAQSLTFPAPVSDQSWIPSLGISVDGHSAGIDPFVLVARDLETMTRSVRSTVSVLQHPVLDRAASHLFSLHGKRLRPIMVILMAHATSTLKVPADLLAAVDPQSSSQQSVPKPSLGPLADAAAAIGQVVSLFSGSLSGGAFPRTHGLLPTPLLDSQLRLAEITEMIHAASLLHDDVIDTADSRRGLPTVNNVFGNQLAVLAGDFLLARASVALARLRDCDVVELLSTVIEHLVRGEVIQMKGGTRDAAVGVADARAAGAGGIGDVSEEDAKRQRHYHEPTGLFESYIAKTFFKTASLMANSCRAVTMLAGHSQDVADAAYSYGEHVGIAFQLVDDMLDFTSNESALGKPVLDDLRQGHATAPVLFALESYPDELGPMISRQFKRPGDVEAAVHLVETAGGVARTRDLAAHHARTAVVTISERLPPSDARSALINIADHVLTRTR